MRRALVLGTANTLWEDLEGALSLGEYDAVYAAKLAGVWFPGRVDVWVGLHPEMFKRHIEMRSRNGFEPITDVVTHVPCPFATRVFSDNGWYLPGMKTSGSSGFMAVAVCLHDGFDRLVLCGMPMTRQGGRIDGRNAWEAAVTYQKRLLPAMAGLSDRVRSMSGWTREHLGPPTADWLEAQDAPSLGMGDQERRLQYA